MPLGFEVYASFRARGVCFEFDPIFPGFSVVGLIAAAAAAPAVVVVAIHTDTFASFNSVVA